VQPIGDKGEHKPGAGQKGKTNVLINSGSKRDQGGEPQENSVAYVERESGGPFQKW